MLSRIGFIASLAVCIPGLAVAQDRTLPPLYGTATLASGFPDDPFGVDVTAGGPVEASAVGKACTGFISRAPDFRLTYKGGTAPLLFKTLAGEDTTLVVNAPDSSWRCDDDSGGGTEALVQFDTPLTGVYDVWVGLWKAEPAQVTLLISGTDASAARFVARELRGGRDAAPPVEAPAEPPTPPMTASASWTLKTDAGGSTFYATVANGDETLIVGCTNGSRFEVARITTGDLGASFREQARPGYGFDGHPASSPTWGLLGHLAVVFGDDAVTFADQMTGKRTVETWLVLADGTTTATMFPLAGAEPLVAQVRAECRVS
jgi:hypothetical protein